MKSKLQSVTTSKFLTVSIPSFYPQHFREYLVLHSGYLGVIWMKGNPVYPN